MAIRVVRLGTPRRRAEGLRVGTVRRPPRGVRRDEIASRDYYDEWLPELAPSAELVAWAQATEWTDARWKTFVRRYRSEMRAPHAKRLLSLLAAISQQTNLAVGCYCVDGGRCHRAVLRQLLIEAGATVVDHTP
jgi:uncharacterized protein YeaO (DUF488 family)